MLKLPWIISLIAWNMRKLKLLEIKSVPRSTSRREFPILDIFSRDNALDHSVHFSPGAAVTHDHRFSGFNSNNIFSYDFWRTEIQNQFQWTKVKPEAELIASGGFKTDGIPGLIQFLEAVCILCSGPLSSVHQSQRCNLLHLSYCLLPVPLISGYFRLHLKAHLDKSRIIISQDF